MFTVRKFSAVFAFVSLFDVTTIYAGSFILKQMIWNVHTPYTPFVVPNRIDDVSESELKVKSRFKISTTRFWSCDNIMFPFCLNYIIWIQVFYGLKPKNDDRLYIFIFLPFFLFRGKRTKRMFMVKVSEEVEYAIFIRFKSPNHAY